MSFIFSRALVEESLQVNCGGTDAYAPLNLIPTRKQSSLLGRTTEPFLRSRFGMTFEILTADLGAELLTSWLAAFPAKTSAQPAPVMGLTASEADSGPKWLGSFAKYDPSASKWKTAQCSLLGDSDEFSETWPRWGSMRNGECYLRPIQMPLIYGNASGSEVMWPTPTVHGNHNMPGASASSGWGLSSAAKLWPTPTASLADKGGRITPRKGHEGVTLIEAVSSRMYPTPCAIDAGSGRVNKSPSPGAAERPTLAMMARKGMWPTPCASASKGSSPAALKRKSGKDRSNDRIDHAVMASDGGQLNPEWVEWLMGWPIGHTALEPLETAKYREWLQQHSPFSSDDENT
ncbi:Uncharacterised protein [Burkholderia pseudomallei]|nr:hypothetical protein [Burkholderia pseudomallei]CAJ2720974.1 Uncharacterised protein [Burkholderia pseudomallei]CAJ2960183.1 Uncharacterised protein [Burkholderia pseudomallei]CAJ4202113.1 Uncharacterised protein [Burkholderia pseudomallei]CAJ5998964.1 Uncharacterised protein [Burkholderia pseudomallei]CAJ7524647.1 Uncharacterised protein [Burkholderia pseudomallei]